MLVHRLVQLKEKSGLTNQQIADKSGVPLSTVTRVFNGQTDNPNYQTVANIVIAMKGSLDDIEGIERPCEETPDKVIELYERSIAQKNQYIKLLAIVCIALVSIIVTVLLIDILNGNIGFVRY